MKNRIWNIVIALLILVNIGLVEFNIHQYGPEYFNSLGVTLFMVFVPIVGAFFVLGTVATIRSMQQPGGL